jgi:hypothetical protein
MGTEINKPPFKSNEGKLTDRYGKPTEKSHNLRVYSNTTLKPKSTPKQENINLYYSNTSKCFKNFQYKIVADNDGNKLLDMYKTIEPKNNEFYIFIEKNDRYNKYGSIFRIKVGSDLEQDKPSFLIKLVQRIRDTVSSIGSDQVDEVLNYLDEDFSHKFLRWARTLIIYSPGAKALEVIINLSEDYIIPGIESFRIDDSRWDINHEKYDPFIPIPDLLKAKDQGNVKFLEEVTSKSILSIERKIKVLSEKIKILKNEKNILNSLVFIRDTLHSKLKQAEEGLILLTSKLKNIKEFAVQLFHTIVANTKELVKFYLQYLNAMLCGLWNSVVDLILSIVSIPILIGKATLECLNKENDPKHYWDKAKEIYENFLEAKDQIDISETLNMFFRNSFKEALTIIRYHAENKSLLHFGKTILVNYAYLSGYLAGFIATLYVEAIYSAGLLAIADIVKRFTNIIQKGASGFQKMSSLMSGKVKNALGVFKSLSELNSKLLAILKKGQKEFFELVSVWVAQFWKMVRKALGIVEVSLDVAIIKFVDILKNNVRYLKCLELVNGGIINGRHGRNLGKWLAVESEAMVKLYTSFVFKELNAAIRSGKQLSREYEAMKKVLNNALEKLPISAYNKGVLQRSAFFTEEEIRKLFVVGEDFLEKGFFSTTHSEKALINWLKQNPTHNVLFKVYGENGKLIEAAAYMPQEAEVLFKSGTRFKVVKMFSTDHPVDISKKILQITLKEI